MKKQAFISVFLWLTSPFATANAATTGYAATSELRIWNGDRNVYVNLEKKGCAVNGSYILEPRHQAYEEILKLLLSAHISRHEVRFRFSNCTSHPHNHGIIESIFLK